MTSPYIITLVAPQNTNLNDEDVHLVRNMAEAAGFVVGAETWLAENQAMDLPLRASDESQREGLVSRLKTELEHVDAIFQPDDGNRRKKLLICDMDSTIIQQECIDELADEMGIKPHVAKITERAMRGELDFKMALRERVGLLKGLEVEALQRVYDNRIKFMPGAKELVATMHAHGAFCMLVSGGFTYFTGKVRDALGFDSDSANILEVADGKLSGVVVEPILDKEAKLFALKEAAYKHDTRLTQTLAIGDGANDLPMLQAAGLGIAYHAKPAVRLAAAACINHCDLRAALYAQGYKKSEFTH
ncbi:MAG: phosphoserine phosphatase SerB [Alphaproteobacteria bacterium]|nr:phosphoserine phosphatase SerB [Alphaproteobacteria bacterium]